MCELPNGSGTAETPAAETRPELNLETLDTLKRADLTAWCRQLGLAEDGKAEDLRERVRCHHYGGKVRFVPGRSIGPCGHIIAIVHSEAGQYRRYKCLTCGARGKLPW